jgi:hypothetical protein
MNEPSPTVPQPSTRAPLRLSLWFALLFGAAFLILCAVGLMTQRNTSSSKWILIAALAAVVLAVLGSAAVLFFRWVFCWRNFRRLMFGLACFLTLIALAWSEENWRGRRAWLRHRHEWEAKGQKFDITALLPPPVADDKNFALSPLLKPVLDFTQTATGVVWHDTNGLARLDEMRADLPAGRATNDYPRFGSLEKGTFADLAACAEFYRGNTNYPQAVATATAAETILVALAKFKPELHELRDAVLTRPESRFPIQYDYQPTWGILLPHLSRVKALTLFACMQATAELEAGHADEAFEDLNLGSRLSDGMRDEPILIDHLVRVATLSLVLETLREGLVRHAWTEAQLSEVETHLAATDILAEYKLAMRGERALSAGGLDYLRSQGSRTTAMYYLSNDEGGSGVIDGLAIVPNSVFYQNMLTISRVHEQFTEPAVDEQARRVFPEICASQGRALNQMRRTPYTIFAKLLLPALGNAVRKSARMQTCVDEARVACALERHRLATGALPESLGPLVPRFLKAIPADVIDGQPLRYRRDAEGGYCLYSIGWNQKDDGGQIAWIKNKKDSSVDVAQGDWVWQMPAK